MYFVYMLRCNDDSLYTGSTTDIEERIAQHNCGKGSKYTRSRLPVALAYSEECISKSAALKREAAIKKLSRGEKIKLIAAAK